MDYLDAPGKHERAILFLWVPTLVQSLTDLAADKQGHLRGTGHLLLSSGGPFAPVARSFRPLCYREVGELRAELSTQVGMWK